MRPIFGLLYVLLFFSYIAVSLFVVFHLLRYSLNRKLALFSTILFCIVMTVLVFTNAMIFFSLPLEEFFPKNYSF